jgi:hypothetical protein
MMDEPQSAKYASGPDWGGVMTKMVVDQMAAYAKSIFPTLPQGVTVRPDWHPTERYKVLDFTYHQYAHRFPNGQNGMINDPGNIQWWVDYSLNLCKRDGLVCTFGINVLNGGIQGQTCPLTTTGGLGENGTPYCKVTAEQLKTWGSLLLRSGAGLYLWEFDDVFVASHQAEFGTLGAAASNLSRLTLSVR